MVGRAVLAYGPEGLPDVEGLRYDPIIEGDYHLDRWHVLEDRTRNVRVHCVRTSDPSDLHDHPWDYVTTLVHGSYVEVTEHGAVRYSAPVTLVRPAEQAHRLEVMDGTMLDSAGHRPGAAPLGIPHAAGLGALAGVRPARGGGPRGRPTATSGHWRGVWPGPRRPPLEPGMVSGGVGGGGGAGGAGRGHGVVVPAPVQTVRGWRWWLAVAGLVVAGLVWLGVVVLV